MEEELKQGNTTFDVQANSYMKKKSVFIEVELHCVPVTLFDILVHMHNYYLNSIWSVFLSDDHE